MEHNIGASLLRLRKQHGLTQRQLELRSGVTQPNISLMENGIYKDPAISTVLKLAKGFGVEISELLAS